MKVAFLILTLLLQLMAFPAKGQTILTAQEVMALAQQQSTVPSEFVQGEMKVYSGERLARFYSFVLGRLWEQETQTEYVRIDFKNAIDPSPSTGHRYLLKRITQTTPTQWLYVPALRRVRITSYRPDEPLLQSDYLFYDLTTIQDFADYRYRFVDANEQVPVIEGDPHTAIVPYQRTISELEQRGETYVVTGIKYLTQENERHARFLDYTEVVPGRFRPRKIIITVEGGRTEILFGQWTFPQPDPQLFTPKSLETRLLTLAEAEKEK
ncbi:MAG: outer membrane lipoprotein-sorting protein [Candidatus Binatia bacterium]